MRIAQIAKERDHSLKTLDRITRAMRAARLRREEQEELFRHTIEIKKLNTPESIDLKDASLFYIINFCEGYRLVRLQDEERFVQDFVLAVNRSVASKYIPCNCFQRFLCD